MLDTICRLWGFPLRDHSSLTSPCSHRDDRCKLSNEQFSMFKPNINLTRGVLLNLTYDHWHCTRDPRAGQSSYASPVRQSHDQPAGWRPYRLFPTKIGRTDQSTSKFSSESSSMREENFTSKFFQSSPVGLLSLPERQAPMMSRELFEWDSLDSIMRASVPQVLARKHKRKTSPKRICAMVVD